MFAECLLISSAISNRNQIGQIKVSYYKQSLFNNQSLQVKSKWNLIQLYNMLNKTKQVEFIKQNNRSLSIYLHITS